MIIVAYDIFGDMHDTIHNVVEFLIDFDDRKLMICYADKDKDVLKRTVLDINDNFHNFKVF